MGTLIYGTTSERVDIDDRTLAHLRVVMVNKLRRHETMTLTWTSEGHVRSLWIHPSIPLGFRFDGPEPTDLNRDWLERLMVAANTAAGLRDIPEHDPGAASPIRRPAARRRPQLAPAR